MHIIRVDGNPLQLRTIRSQDELPSKDAFVRSFTAALDRDLPDVELDAVLVYAVEDAAFVLLEAAGAGSVRLRPSHVRLVPVFFFLCCSRKH